MSGRGSRVSIPCEVHVERGRTFSPDRFHARALGCSGSSFKSEADARAKLAAEIEQRVEEAADMAQNTGRHVIATQEGEVLTVQRVIGSWGWRIDGADRRATCGGGTWGCKSFEDARAGARSHAEQCFGGILWESQS